MIESLVRIVEKLTDLAEYREQKRLREFDEAVRDLYTDVQTVHTDYMRMLEHCLAQLRRGEPLEMIGDVLTEERVTHEALRQKIRSIVDAYRDDSSWRYWNFYRLIGNYFMIGYVRPGSSALLSLRDEIVEATLEARRLEESSVRTADHIATEQLMSFLSNEAIARLRKSWIELSAEYARLLKESRS